MSEIKIRRRLLSRHVGVFSIILVIASIFIVLYMAHAHTISVSALQKQLDGTSSAAIERQFATPDNPPGAQTAGALRDDATIHAKESVSEIKNFARSSIVLPGCLLGFWEWRSDQQLASVTELAKNPTLSDDIVEFMLYAVTDKGLDATARNNIANGLRAQRNQSQEQLYNMFRRMVFDESESYQWREYATQHFAALADDEKLRTNIINTLWNVVEKGERAIPGTALLHLHKIDGLKSTTDFEAPSLALRLNQEIVSVASRSEMDLLARMTAIGLIGERQIRDASPLLRTILKTEGPAIRRVTLASLGAIGGPQDRELLASFLSDPNTHIVYAAKAAISRLDQSAILQ